MIKIQLIVLMVASGVAVEYLVTFLPEPLCSIVTGKDVLLSEVKKKYAL